MIFASAARCRRNHPVQKRKSSLILYHTFCSTFEPSKYRKFDRADCRTKHTSWSRGKEVPVKCNNRILLRDDDPARGAGVYRETESCCQEVEEGLKPRLHYATEGYNLLHSAASH